MVFFSQDLLNINSNKPLAIVWLASTLGSKTSFKKISKKEIAAVKIPYVCKYLADDREQFALRLSSNLLVGVSRVYKLQTDQLLLDANHVLINFKRALFSLQQAPLDQQIAEARPEAITIPLGALDRIIGFNDEQVFKVPPSRAEMAAAAGRKDSDTSTSLSLSLAAPGSARDKTIMSSGSGHLSQHSSFGIPQPAFPSSSIPGASAKSSFSAGGDLKSALEISDPLLRVPKTSRPPSSDKGIGGSEGDFLLEGDDLLFVGDDLVFGNDLQAGGFGDFNDDYGPMDFDFPIIEPAAPKNGDELEEKRLEDRDGSDPNLMDLDADLNGQAQPSSEKDFDVSQEKTPKRTPKPKPKRNTKKRKYSLIDTVISLTDTQLHDMRTNSNLVLQENAIAMFRAERLKKQEQMIKDIPNLWKQRYPESMHKQIEEQRAGTLAYRLGFDFVPRPAAAIEEYEADEEEEEQRGRSTKRAKKFVDDGFVDDYYGADEFDVAALENRVAAADLDLSLEVGRGASEGGEMPWHAPKSETGTASSARGSKRTTPLRRGLASREVESPLAFDFEGQGRQGPSSTSNDAGGFQDLGAFDESSFEKIVREGSERTNGGEITDVETRAFYEYVKILAIETQSNSIFLLDICQDQPRKTAAAAFYNVLRCAHEGIVEVNQVEGDVEIMIFSSS